MRIARRQKSPGLSTGRRNFLRAAAFLGPAIAAIFSGRSHRPLPAATRKPTAPEGTRYRLTDHVRKYYEKTSI